MYRLEYLPIARRDMVEIARYISHELCNPIAAKTLAEEMLEKAEKLTETPYLNAIYICDRPLQHEYRKLIVQNYIMFYWVDEKEKMITIARVVYARRDYARLM